MKIQVDGLDIDLETINNFEDMKKLVEEAKPSSTISYDEEAHGEVIVNDKYVPFDFLTEKEKGIINLLLAVAKVKNEVYDQLFPAKNKLINLILSAISDDKDKDLIKQDVNIELWTIYNKLTYLYQFIKIQIDVSLYARLGYELFLVYEPNGKISTIKDLRDIPSETSIF